MAKTWFLPFLPVKFLLYGEREEMPCPIFGVHFRLPSGVGNLL